MVPAAARCPLPGQVSDLESSELGVTNYFSPSYVIMHSLREAAWGKRAVDEFQFGRRNLPADWAQGRQWQGLRRSKTAEKGKSATGTSNKEVSLRAEGVPGEKWQELRETLWLVEGNYPEHV
jgi:hypothetical protein